MMWDDFRVGLHLGGHDILVEGRMRKDSDTGELEFEILSICPEYPGLYLEIERETHALLSST